MASLQDRCTSLIRGFRQRPDASARTLLVTVFGDCVEPHGGEVWAGSLLRLVEPLGINERLARTSLNRLVGEGSSSPAATASAASIRSRRWLDASSGGRSGAPLLPLDPEYADRYPPPGESEAAPIAHPDTVY